MGFASPRAGRSVRSLDQIPHLGDDVRGETWLVSSAPAYSVNFVVAWRAAEVSGKKFLSFPASVVDLHVKHQGLETGIQKDEQGGGAHKNGAGPRSQRAANVEQGVLRIEGL